jgi:DNA repair exonuclease SbcCD ATPase subunit|tara:strand:+ start:349 stop:642 length:294 start_codon:yes stop_codon:yes gene_type:complete
MADFIDRELEKINAGLAQTEAAKKEADKLMINKIAKYENEIATLKKENERLAEENSNILTITSSHKELNGELQVKLTKAEEKIKDFEKNYIRIDGKK